MSDPEAPIVASGVADLVGLAGDDEPTELRHALRAVAGEHPEAFHLQAIDAVAPWLFLRWGAVLAACGIEETEFARIVRGADRELWLWVMGDRPYGQLVSSIAGRTVRRFPSLDSKANGWPRP